MSRKCLVLCNRSLLAQGVANILSLNPDLEITLVDVEMEDPAKTFRKIRPEVVIVDVSEMVTVKEPFWSFIQERPGVTLVCMDPLSNGVLIVRSEPRVLRSVQDLFAALDEENIPVKGGVQ